MKKMIAGTKSKKTMQTPVIRMYDYLRKQTGLPGETVAAICFYGDLFFWLAVGCLAGWMFCMITGSRDYINVIGGTGAFLAIILGAVMGLVRIFLHAGEN